MEIGGFFPYQPVGSEPNNYVEHTCPDPGDTAHLMSGRCAIYYCLRDLMLTDQKRVAYLPSYDCETVLGCFVKAGYEIHYYDFDKNLSPVFEEEMIPQISVLLVCGYYGYPTYDENFVKKCKASGVSVIVDTTHTAFSPLPACPDADYIAVSLRKWMGVASGGLAIKRKGTFGVKLFLSIKNSFPLEIRLFNPERPTSIQEMRTIIKKAMMFSGKRNLCFVKFSISRKGMKLPLKRFFIIHSGMRSVNARKITVTFWNTCRNAPISARYFLIFQMISVLCFSLSLWKTGTPLSSIWQTGTFRLKYTGLYHLL